MVRRGHAGAGGVESAAGDQGGHDALAGGSGGDVADHDGDFLVGIFFLWFTIIVRGARM